MRASTGSTVASVAAQQTLTLDILTSLLAHAANPSGLGEYLTSQMRELTGARTVALLQYPLGGSPSAGRLIHVSPVRRRHGVGPLLEWANETPGIVSEPTVCEDTAGPAWWPTLASRLAATNALFLPLLVGDENVAVLVICDLPEMGRRTTEVVELLRPLCPVVALALRQSLLFEQQEATIEERTRQVTEVQQRLAHAQRLESIGRLAGGIAHDFNNVLTPILAHAELALGRLPDESPFREDLEGISSAARRARDLVRQILAFSRHEEQPRQAVNLHALVVEALRLLRALLPSTIRIEHHLDPRTRPVYAVPSQLHQVLMNLGTNALYAMRTSGGTLDVTLGPAVDRQTDRPMVRLRVADTGQGIEPAALDRIFDPYFTTKPAGEGTGLGLAVVHGIITGFGGSIRVDSAEGRGTAFEIQLPVHEEQAEAAPVPAAPEAGSGRVLFVDDEPAIASLGRRMLTMLGYTVTAVMDSREALDVFRANPSAFDLVISDYTLPGLKGDDLARAMLSIRSDIPIILCTGYSESIDDEKAKALGARGLIMKPFDIATLSASARAATAPAPDAEDARHTAASLARNGLR